MAAKVAEVGSDDPVVLGFMIDRGEVSPAQVLVKARSTTNPKIVTVLGE